MPGKKQGQSFGRAVRIRRSSEVVATVRRGAQKKGSYFAVYRLENRLQHNRYAVIVSRKAGNAVERNRIKRRIRENLRKKPDTGAPYCDIVVHVHAKFPEK